MCENATIYNKPDTIYYKAAKKLLHSGMKILSPVSSPYRDNCMFLCTVDTRGQRWDITGFTGVYDEIESHLKGKFHLQVCV